MMKKQIKASPVKGRKGLFLAWGIDPSTLRRKKYFAATPEEARQRAAESFKPPNPVETLDAFYAEAYLPTVAHRSENWRGQIAWAMDDYVRPTFGLWKLRDITRSDAQRFFNGLIGTLKPSSLRRVKIVFSGVMNLAEADEQIAKNPVRPVKLPPDEDTEKTALTYDELGRLIRHSQKELHELFQIEE